MEMQQLKHFLVTARTGSLALAAEELHISQSGLSRSLKALEDFFGLNLLIRRARGVELTAHGLGLLPHARLIWNERCRTVSAMKSYRTLGQGHVEIALHPALANDIGAQIIDRLSERFPDLSVNIITLPYPDILERLASGELDFSFSLFPESAPASRSGLIHDKLFSLECRVYVRHTHPLAAKGEVDIKDLSNAPWVLAAGTSFYDAFAAFFQDRGVSTPRRVLRCSSLELLINIATRRDLLTVLPILIGQSTEVTAKLTPIAAPTPTGETFGGLIYRSDMLETPATSSAMSICREIASLL